MEFRTACRRATASFAVIAAVLLVLPGADASPDLRAEPAQVDVPGSTGLPSDPDYPGLPDYKGNAFTGSWIPAMSAGMSHIGAAKQWTRLPNDQTPAFNVATQYFDDVNCRRGGLIDGKFQRYREWTAYIFLRDGLGTDKSGYGQMAPMTVRTVAFGSVPVEATITVRQLRDANDVLIPIDFLMGNGTYCPNVSPFPGVVPPGGNSFQAVDVVGQVRVHVDDLRVDGVPVRLNDTCTTASPSTLQLTSKPWYEGQPESWGVTPTAATQLVTPHFNPANGGLLTGSVDIPSFTGCRTASGDDVSPLLSATVSGSDNYVELRNTGLSSTCGDLESAACTRLDPLDIPTTDPPDA